MFHRGWFLIDTPDLTLSRELVGIFQRYAVARVSAVDAKAELLLRQPGRVAGLVLQVSSQDVARLERLRTLAPQLPVLALLAESERPLINRLQQRGVEVAMLPVFAPNVVSFAQRALVASFLPHERVARTVAQLAESRQLSAREVQILSYYLGNEPRARVRRRLGIGENTLKTQIRGLLRKCNERSVDALAKNVLRAALLESQPGAQLVEPIAPWLAAVCSGEREQSKVA